MNKLSTKIKTEQLVALSRFSFLHRLVQLSSQTHSGNDSSRIDCQAGPPCPPDQDAVSHRGTKDRTGTDPLSWSSPSKDTDLSSKLLVCVNNQLWDFTPSMSPLWDVDSHKCFKAFLKVS